MGKRVCVRCSTCEEIQSGSQARNVAFNTLVERSEGWEGGTEGKAGYNVEKGGSVFGNDYGGGGWRGLLRIRRSEYFDFTSGCRLLEHQMKLDTDTDETKRRKKMMMTCWKNHHVCQ